MASVIDKKSISREELKLLVRELMQEIIWEMEQQAPSPDEGLELSPEFAALLEAARKQKDTRELISHEEVMRRLDLD